MSNNSNIFCQKCLLFILGRFGGLKMQKFKNTSMVEKLKMLCCCVVVYTEQKRKTLLRSVQDAYATASHTVPQQNNKNMLNHVYHRLYSLACLIESERHSILKNSLEPLCREEKADGSREGDIMNLDSFLTNHL